MLPNMYNLCLPVDLFFVVYPGVLKNVDSNNAL